MFTQDLLAPPYHRAPLLLKNPETGTGTETEFWMSTDTEEAEQSESSSVCGQIFTKKQDVSWFIYIQLNTVKPIYIPQLLFHMICVSSLELNPYRETMVRHLYHTPEVELGRVFVIASLKLPTPDFHPSHEAE